MEIVLKIIIGIVSALIGMLIVKKMQNKGKKKEELKKEKTPTTIKNEIVPKKWLDLGIIEPQQVIDVINEAFSNKEKLDSNIYIGNTKFGNICVCLTLDGKIENAFPVKVTKEEYFNIKSKVQEIGLGNDLNVEVVSLLIAIDLKNYKDELINNIDKTNVSYIFDLFSIYVDKSITVIDVGDGKIAINTNIIKNYILNDSIEL